MSTGAAPRWVLPEGATLYLQRGDLTRSKVDAIVNAANAIMLGGGGVDGAIHRAAGPELRAACAAVPAVDGVRCRPGQAHLTPGFQLAAHHVIHTVGPIYGRDPDPPATLAAAYRSSLACAREAGLRSIAFPALSCGAFGYPLDEAAEIAVDTVLHHAAGLEQVWFYLMPDAVFRAWHAAATDALGPPGGP